MGQIPRSTERIVVVEWNCVKQYISFSVIAVSRQVGYSEDIVGMHCQQFKK